MIKFLIISFIFLSTALGVAGEELTLSESDLNLSILSVKKTFQVKEQKFDYLVLDFWASWCGPCRESMPFFNEQYLKWKDQSVLFIGVNVDEDVQDAKSYLQKNPIAYMTLTDKDHILANKLGVTSIPRTFIFDKSLKLVKSLKGYTPEKHKIFKEEFEMLFKQRRQK